MRERGIPQKRTSSLSSTGAYILNSMQPSSAMKGENETRSKIVRIPTKPLTKFNSSMSVTTGALSTDDSNSKDFQTSQVKEGSFPDLREHPKRRSDSFQNVFKPKDIKFHQPEKVTKRASDSSLFKIKGVAPDPSSIQVVDNLEFDVPRDEMCSRWNTRL